MVIAINGKKRAGKDYIADLIMKEVKATRHTFAEPLKRLCGVSLGCTIEKFDEMKNNNQSLIIDDTVGYYFNYGNTYRNFIVNLGQNIKKEFGEEIFVNKVINDIKSNPNDIHIITDMRMMVELNLLQENFGINLVTIRVEDYNIKCDGCETETELDNEEFDFSINNTDKNIELTTIQVKSILKSIGL